MQRLCNKVAANPWFDRLIVALIVINAVVLGMETSPDLVARYGEVFLMINHLVLGVFVLEAVIKITAVAPRFRLYFGDGWNLFDFTIVVLSLIPSTGEYAMIARLARLLRRRFITNGHLAGGHLVGNVARHAGGTVGRTPTNLLRAVVELQGGTVG